MCCIPGLSAEECASRRRVMLPGAFNPQQKPQPCPVRLCRPLHVVAEGQQQRHRWTASVHLRHVWSLNGTKRAWRNVAVQYAAQPQPQPPVNIGSSLGQPGTDDRGQQHSHSPESDSSASASHSGSVSRTQQQAGQQNGAAAPPPANGAMPSAAPVLEMLAQQDFGRCGIMYAPLILLVAKRGWYLSRLSDM